MVANYHKGGLFMLSENSGCFCRCAKFGWILWRGLLPMDLSWEFFETRTAVPFGLVLGSCGFLTFAQIVASCILFSFWLKNPCRWGFWWLFGMSAGRIFRLSLSVLLLGWTCCRMIGLAKRLVLGFDGIRLRLGPIREYNLGLLSWRWHRGFRLLPGFFGRQLG